MDTLWLASHRTNSLSRVSSSMISRAAYCMMLPRPPPCSATPVLSRRS